MGKPLRQTLGPVFWLRLQSDIIELHNTGLPHTEVRDEVWHKHGFLFEELGIKLAVTTIKNVVAQYSLDKSMYHAALRATVAKHIELPERIDAGSEIKACIATAAAIRDWGFEQIDKAPTDALAGNYAKLALDASRAVVTFAAEAPMSIDELDEESNETSRLHGMLALALEAKDSEN